jgi:peptidyl-prolyl cis-trans isomerase C
VAANSFYTFHLFLAINPESESLISINNQERRMEIHCAHILVKTEEEAKQVLMELRKNRKFSEIAKEKSLCPSGKDGGDLGKFSRGRMVREFEKAAFSLEKGGISEPVKTEFGWHIIKRLE